MKIDRSKKRVIGKRFFFVSFLILSYFITIYVYNKQEQNRKLFESLSITFKDKPMIEYGTDHYDVEKFVESSSGKVKITKGNLDSMNIGMQEVVLKVEKGGIHRNFSFKVEVKDTKSPEIEIKEDVVSLCVGDTFDPISNISSVYDLVDGDLNYVPLGNITKNHKNYYTYETNFDASVVGQYYVNIRALDKHGNLSSKSFSIHVEKPVYEEKEDRNSSSSIMDVRNINISTVADGSKEGVIQIAKSLVGLPYVSGGNSLSGFDCSGFVSYVFGVNGISISRTTGGQLYIGESVSVEEAMPGDILVFSNNFYGTPTHSAIYVGGGNMIHAANPRKGVIISNVSEYASYGNHILSVRRV